MKKKWQMTRLIPVGLAVFCLGFLLAGLTIPRSFRSLPRGEYGMLPVRAAKSIAILKEGTFPGMSDTPVTTQETVPGRKAMYTLEQQKYTWALPFHKPREDGIALYELTGCSPEYKAYWDGRYLWLPPEQYNAPWRGYAPSSPAQLEESLEVLCK